MASTLVLGENGISTLLANRLASEGHIVKVWTRGPSKVFTGTHNPSRVGDPTKMLDQYDLVVAGNLGLGDLCASITSKGKVVIGGSVFSDKMTVDIDYRDRVIKGVIKRDPTATSDGLYLITTGWFDGEDWTRPFSHSIATQRFMDGDKGCKCTMGCVVWSSVGDKITAELLEPLASLLVKVEYIGPISVLCTVTDSQLFPVAYAPCFLYDTTQAWMELIKLSLFDYLYKMSCKQLREAEHHTEHAMAVRLSVLPYPHEYMKLANTDGLLAVPDEAKRHVWQTSSLDGVLGCVTARGQTVRECERRAYRTISNIVKSQDVQYRSDVGSGIDETRKQLVEWQWLN